jgi:hypothetical protein
VLAVSKALMTKECVVRLVACVKVKMHKLWTRQVINETLYNIMYNIKLL